VERRFVTGDQVVLRRVWEGNICRVTSATVVQDSEDQIALYWGPGYPLKVTRNPLKVSSDKSLLLRDVPWGDTHVLMLAPPGAGYAIYAMWEKDSYDLGCWYINLQEPLSRIPIGFDTMDYLLDINVSPDRSEWSWKDGGDFNEAVKAGKIPIDKAETIRSEGEKAIQLLQEDSTYFFGKWESWKPSSEWKIPSIPEGWGKIYTK